VSFGDVLGLLGAGLFLAAYGLTQARRLDGHGVAALSMNLAGALLVVLSLTQKFNLAAFVLEIAWGLIALFGLVRLAIARFRARAGRRTGRPG
jgi:hypothetical protein